MQRRREFSPCILGFQANIILKVAHRCVCATHINTSPLPNPLSPQPLLLNRASTARLTLSVYSLSNPQLLFFRVCGGAERALIPDGVLGLPVWNNDPRWSLLGYALERRRAPSSGAAATATVQEGCEATLHYVDWMDVLLQVTATFWRGVLL